MPGVLHMGGEAALQTRKRKRPSASNQGNAAVKRFISECATDLPGTLFALDVDGTISPIAPSPAEASVPPPLRSVLTILARRSCVSFITGRDAAEAQQMVDIASARYVGGHGFEVLDQRGLRDIAPRRDVEARLRQIAIEVTTDVPEIGPHVERMRWGTAFHYRALASNRSVVTRLRRSIEAHLPPDLRIQRGKCVIEVLPRRRQNKGTALEFLIAEIGLRRVLAAGDDMTDEAMFKALTRQRRAGVVDGLNVAVRHREDTPRALLATADVEVEGVDGLCELLTQTLL